MKEDSRNYTCLYCHIEYVPKRRRIQKYCSDSCRSGAHKLKNKTITTSETQIAELPLEQTLAKIEKMSLAGAGNATAGSLAADAIKAFFTKDVNKPATKGDIYELYQKLKRYHEINNLPPRHDGTLPYFDLETNEIVYSLWPL